MGEAAQGSPREARLLTCQGAPANRGPEEMPDHLQVGASGTVDRDIPTPLCLLSPLAREPEHIEQGSATLAGILDRGCPVRQTGLTTRQGGDMHNTATTTRPRILRDLYANMAFLALLINEISALPPEVLDALMPRPVFTIVIDIIEVEDS